MIGQVHRPPKSVRQPSPHRLLAVGVRDLPHELGPGLRLSRRPVGSIEAGVAHSADDSTITAPMPYRQGLLPSVRVFIDHLAAEFPKAVLV
jgi:hypothetical protein